MSFYEMIPALLVLSGAVIMLVSVAIGLRIGKEVPYDLKGRWRITISLMVFFFVGYIFAVYILLREELLSLEVVTGGVFFGGACFVYLVIKLSRTTISRIEEKDRAIEEYANGLARRTEELEREVEVRKKAEEQARMRLQNLSALHTIDMLISSSLELDFTLNAVLEQVVSLLRVDAACILLLDPNTQELSYFAGLGFRSEGVKKTRQRVGEGSAGRSALEHVMVEHLDVRDGFDRTGQLEAEGFVSYIAVPLTTKGTVSGVLEVYKRSRLEPVPEWKDFLNALALQIAIAIDNSRMFHEIQRSNSELILAYDTTLEGWSHALELRDKETEGHTQRVVDLAMRVAREMGVKESELVHIRRGALIHDIGKMSIPDSILLKTGPLTDDEWEVMRRHPTYAFKLMSPISYLRPALDIPYCHHEKWDGTGYPRGLKGEQIPLAARIFSVVDMWDALLSERRYHHAWSRQRACSHIESLSGTHFDPRVVDAFIRLVCTGGREEIPGQAVTDMTPGGKPEIP